MTAAIFSHEEGNISRGFPVGMFTYWLQPNWVPRVT